MWAEHWHSEPTRLFDFSKGNHRIEIKTTSKPERIHEFSHRQLFSLSSEEISIVSMMLREEDAGLSLRSLIEEAKKNLRATPYFIKLEKAVRSAGMDNSSDTGPRFNDLEASRQLAWYGAESVPRFRTQEPEGVSGTHYRSDLTNAPKLTAEQVKDWMQNWDHATSP